jgi:hypothetical protein
MAGGSNAFSPWRGAAEAKAVLVAGEPFLENEAIFHCNLACYDCALGNLEDAKKGLARAFDWNSASGRQRSMNPIWSAVGVVGQIGMKRLRFPIDESN